MIQYTLVIAIGILGGAVVGYCLTFSLGLLTILRRGFYYYDYSNDVYSASMLPALGLGIPIGSLVGIVLSLIVFQLTKQLSYVAVVFVIGSGLTFMSLNYLERLCH